MSELREPGSTPQRLFNPRSTTPGNDENVLLHISSEEPAPTVSLSTAGRGLLQRRSHPPPTTSLETFQGTKVSLPASHSHCDPAIVWAAFGENDSRGSRRTCNALNKCRKEGELHRSEGRPVYQRRLHGLRGKEQEVCALALTCQHRGKGSIWIKILAVTPFCVHTPSFFLRGI